MTSAAIEAPANLQTPTTPVKQAAPPNRWLVTLAVMTGTISTVLASTIVNVALPDIMGAFGMGQDQAQWMSTGFLASMTATMLIAAWSVSRFGLRMTFTTAMLAFIASSIMAGLAGTESELILARVLQGASAGVTQPLAMIAMFSVFPPHQRGTAMGIFGLGVVLAPAIGPTIGGILIELFNWRVVFFIIIPFSILAVFLGSTFLPGRQAKTAPKPFDFAGFLLLCLALVFVLNGLSNGQREGWNSAYILSMLGIGSLFAVLFLAWQGYAAHPLLELSLLRNRTFLAACIVAFIYGAGLYGSTYLIPLFGQSILHLTAKGVGLVLMPSGLIMALIFPISGRLSDRISAPLMICAGLILFGSSLLFMYAVDTNTPLWLLAAWIAFGRAGLGVMLPSLNAGGVRSLPAQSISQGAGMLNFIRQLGGAFGTNLLSILLSTRLAFHANALTATQNGGLSATYRWISLYKGMLARAGVQEGLPQKYGALYHLGRTILAQAYTLSFRDCFIVVGLMFLAAMIPAVMMYAKVVKKNTVSS